MNRPQAEKLLGGYAAGILTDSEKRELFAAALEHQELFDALMDEEALRELLADPEIRRRLLTTLLQPEERTAKKLWRRPAVLGLAASLFAILTTSLLVWQSPRYRFLPAAQSQANTQPQIPAGAVQDKAEPAPAGPILQKPLGQPRPSIAEQPKRLAKAEAGVSKAAPMAPADSPGMEASNRASQKEEEKDAEVVAAAPNMARASGASIPGESAGAMGADAPAAKKLKGALQADAGFQAENVAPFEATLEHLPGGRARLKVTWGPRGYLYAIRRTSSGSTLLAPLHPLPGKAGMRTALFETALGEQDVLDVYVLVQPATDPESLPAEGVIQGERRRVYPE